MTRRTSAVAAAAIAAGGCLSACTSGQAAESSVALTATDSRCALASTELASGPTTFAITNEGSTVTELYVYGKRGGTYSKIVTEKENIGPGTSYDLTVSLQPGRYEVACTPGQKGDGIRTPITVSGQAGSGVATTDADAAQAVAAYRAYVQSQADALVPLVDAFVAAVKAGDAEKARSLYAGSRVPWERIEPVAESFGDLDPRVD